MKTSNTTRFGVHNGQIANQSSKTKMMDTLMRVDNPDRKLTKKPATHSNKDLSEVYKEKATEDVVDASMMPYQMQSPAPQGSNITTLIQNASTQYQESMNVVEQPRDDMGDIDNILAKMGWN